MHTTVVWLKRDLRVHDHAPIASAAKGGQLIALYVFEPKLWALPQMSRRQFDFICDSLRDLADELRDRGGQLLIRTGDILPVLSKLHQETGFDRLFAHQETGQGWTYGRDLAVFRWCENQGIDVAESTQDGVMRGGAHKRLGRDGWARRRNIAMRRPIIQPPEHIRSPKLVNEPLPSPDSLGLGPALQDPQPGGRTAGLSMLKTFLRTRCQGYQRNMSSPVTAWEGCSRLSPHLAWGTLSVKEVEQRTESAKLAYKQRRDYLRVKSLDAFGSRLAWRGHFMQKLEDQPSIEFRNLQPATERLRGELDQAKFDAWCQGRTGYPMVDATMRMVCATGWLNFRMRAMLASFACYDLWLPWQQPAAFLAAQFTDYEPGIHYCQFQMQSGSTGINSLRIYDPTKQAYEHDPDGSFIRKWVVELANVPDIVLREPWRLTKAQRQEFDLGAYPAIPIVNHQTARKQALAKISALRRGREASMQAQQVMFQHGSRHRRR